jgi:ribose transport system permease protein
MSVIDQSDRAADAVPAEIRRRSPLSGLFSQTGQVATLAVVLVLMFIFFAITDERRTFTTSANLINILRQVSYTGVVAVGATMVLLIGGIDLSVSSVLALTGVVSASLMLKTGWPPVQSLAAALVVAALVGVVNGIIITWVRISPLITTLATLTIVRGLAYTLTGGLPIFAPPGTQFPADVRAIGQGYAGPIPIPVILMGVAFVIGYIFLYRTYIGRHIYAIGGNEEAARLSGIRVIAIKLLVYGISGLLAGVAGLIVLGRVGSGQPSVEQGFELEVITAVVLGGVSISGGKGNLLGVLLGVLIMGVLRNGLILLNVSEYTQMMIRGGVLLVAVGLDRLRIIAGGR